MKYRILVLWILLALTAGCGKRVDTLQPEGAPHRNPLAWAADGLLPLPSNAYLQNGLLLADRAMWTEPVLEHAPTLAAATLRRIARRNGFSPNLPVVFAAPGVIDAASLPTREQSAAVTSTVRLIDLGTGQAVGFEPELNTIDDTTDGLISVILLLPERRLDDGHRYLVVVAGLRDKTGALVRKAHAAEQEWRAPSPAVREAGEAVASVVPAAGRAGIQLAYTFTTGTNLYGPFEDLKAKIDLLTERFPATFKHTPPSRHRFPPMRPGTRWDVNGTFVGWRFVGEDGEIWATPERHSVQVLLALPASCPPGGCPVVIFCHGLQAFKETMYQVAGPLNQKGIAVIGVDGLWHERFTDSMHVINGLSKRYEMFSGLVYQHVAFQWQLVKLIQGNLPALDLLPVADGGDGKPDLDTTRIGFIGQSLGGISGVSVVAFEPAIDAAIFNVAGGGFYQMFTRSMLRSLIRVPLFDIGGLSPAQGYAATFLGSMGNDFVDPLLSAGRLVGDKRPILLQVGLDDGLVPNDASDLLARTLGLHLVEPAYPGKARGIEVKPGELVGGYSYSDWGFGAYLRHVVLNGEKQAGQTADFFSQVLRP